MALRVEPLSPCSTDDVTYVFAHFEAVASNLRKIRYPIPFMPRLSGAVQCLWGEGRGAARGGDLPALSSITAAAAGAGADVQICPQCERGNIYCAAECSQVARREGTRRAGGRYQRTLRGARQHAQWQRRYRPHRREVAHGGCKTVAGGCRVSLSAVHAWRWSG